MSKYSCDFDITSVELLPVHKRVNNIKNVLFSLVAPLNELETVFTYLREGSAAGNYSGIIVYTFGQFVNYQRRVYYRNQVTAGYSAGVTPNNSTYFVPVLEYSIGLDERIRFSPQKILLEYALNRIFQTTFNQPPTLSDIYITNENTDDDAFVVGDDDEDTSTVSQTDELYDWAVTELDPDVGLPDFVIHVPVAVWTALAGTPTERDNIILSVANKIKLFGYKASVTTY
jgi:hypothetical protein